MSYYLISMYTIFKDNNGSDGNAMARPMKTYEYTMQPNAAIRHRADQADRDATYFVMSIAAFGL